MRCLSRLILPLLFAIGNTNADLYYIDYSKGNDQNDGLTANSPWKHAPGDKNAKAKAAAAELKPGDTVRFKGGVRYHGEISLHVSGNEDKPITLDGNVDGKYGNGPAILDGAQMIDNWKPVNSAAQVAGNPLWKKIMYADVHMDLSSNFDQGFVLHRDKSSSRQAPWQRMFLIDGDQRVLPVAQQPKPSDPFYPDLPKDFYRTPDRLGSTYPHKVYYDKGSKGNSSLPLIGITYGGAAPVVEPFNGGTVSVDLNVPTEIAEMGFKLYRPGSFPAPEHVVFLADDKVVLRAKADASSTEMQRFKLPRSLKTKKLSYRLESSKPAKQRWTKLHQIAAYTRDGGNVIKHRISTDLVDAERLAGKGKDDFHDVFIGVHGGNNHVYFAPVEHYDPVKGRLKLPYFSATTYKDTRYAFYNSPRFIQLPGEWCVEALGENKARVFLLPEQLKNDRPVNVGFPIFKSALHIHSGASHINIKGFLIQRYAGGQGGIATSGRGKDRPSHIHISDCEVRFLSTHAGISLNHSDHITVENCHVHHCPGWTVGIYVNRINNYLIKDNLIDTNSGSGIRHYEAKQGKLVGNRVLNHFGMHSSGINFYEGCRDIQFEGNYVENVIAINRSIENLTLRNNVINSDHRSPVSIAMWQSGRVGGRHIKNITIANNTLINTDAKVSWATSIFVQQGASAPENLVIRNNVLDLLRPVNPGLIENNIFMRQTDAKVLGANHLLVSDAAELFVNPARGDYRRKPASPKMEAGANLRLPAVNP